MNLSITHLDYKQFLLMHSSKSIFIQFYILPLLFSVTTTFYFSPFFIDLVDPGKLSGFLFGMNLIVWTMLILSLWLGYLIWLIRHTVRKSLTKHHWLSAGIIYATYIIIGSLFSQGYMLSV